MAVHDANPDEDDDDAVDVNAFINTGPGKGLFMPCVDEEPAFRARDDQAGRPMSSKQRLVFHGFSQETPPAADTQDKPAGFVFSPNTLHRTAGEEIAARVEDPAAKKHRKRTKNKDKAASQPLPRRIRAQDDMVPPRDDGLNRVHVAGEPILPPELRHLAQGSMMALHEGILTLERILLNDKSPNYPVYTVKVPKDVGFVSEAPADIFFIAYEDIFKLFLSKRLDYNLVRLFALNLAMKVTREKTPGIAVADPYYMRDSQLIEGSGTRAQATAYLQKFLLDNKRKDNVIVPFFPE